MANRIILGINFALVVAVLLLSFAMLSISRTFQSLPERIAALERAVADSDGPGAPSGPRGSRVSEVSMNPKLAAELRQLIRDELRAGALITVDAPGVTSESADDRAPAQSLDSNQLTEAAWQAVLVNQEIDFYVARGAISETEMSALQSEIAKLGPKDRTGAMRRLIGAINAGELDGRL